MAAVTAMPDFKRLRERSGFTLREVETHTKISNAYLSQLENGKIKSPSYRIVTALVDFYKNNTKPGHDFATKWNEMTKEIEAEMELFDDEKKIKTVKAIEDLGKIIFC